MQKSLQNDPALRQSTAQVGGAEATPVDLIQGNTYPHGMCKKGTENAKVGTNKEKGLGRSISGHKKR